MKRRACERACKYPVSARAGRTCACACACACAPCVRARARLRPSQQIEQRVHLSPHHRVADEE
eukprot:6213333-Pleurochrysis_carterae.AAC.5